MGNKERNIEVKVVSREKREGKGKKGKMYKFKDRKV